MNNLPKKEQLKIASEIIKSAYINKGKILKDDVDIFYSIDMKTRFEAQRYVQLGWI